MMAPAEKAALTHAPGGHAHIGSGVQAEDWRIVTKGPQSRDQPKQTAMSWSSPANVETLQMAAAGDKIKEEAKVSPRTRQRLRPATPLQMHLAFVGLWSQVEHPTDAAEEHGEVKVESDDGREAKAEWRASRPVKEEDTEKEQADSPLGSGACVWMRLSKLPRRSRSLWRDGDLTSCICFVAQGTSWGRRSRRWRVCRASM